MSIRHIAALDGLRAVAVLAVVAFHAELITGGWIGVDLFFVLSGFLITTLLRAEVESAGAIALGSFWMRRIRRLLPAVGVLVVFVIALQQASQLVVRSRGVWGAATYSTNWLQLAAGQGYWDAFATPDPLSHLWSLAVEEQFYLIWPVLVVLVAKRWGTRGIQRLAIVGVGAAAALQVIGLVRGWPIDRMYVGTDTRALAFLLGAAISGPACRGLFLRPSTLIRRVRNGAVIVSSLTLAATALWLKGDQVGIFRGPLQAASLASALLILASPSITHGPLTWSPIRALGRWSYGIYLFHWPLTIATSIVDQHPWVRFVVVAVLSTALAALSYRVIEMPIRLRTVSRLGLFAVGVVTCGALVGSLLLAQPIGPLLATQPTLGPPTTAAIDVPESTATVPAHRRVMIVGDSVPAAAAAQLATEATRRDIDLEIRAEPGCVGSPFAVDQLVPDICGRFIDGLAARIAVVQPNVVLIWFGGTGQWFQHNGIRYDFCSSQGRVAYTARLKFLASLVPAGSTSVKFVLPVPRADLGPDAALGANCESDITSTNALPMRYGTLALTPAVCPSFPDDCQRVARPDGLHYSAAGASIVAAYLFEQLAR